ncbi:MAG: hypothetical protein AAFN93_15105 [Bacteroidota bacterium]
MAPSFFQTQYEKIIQPALTEINIECVRGDEIYTKQRIVDDIWVSIRNCRFLLAELTGKNPNVMYEIGLAHAIGKPVIIITRNDDDVPFDLKAIRYLFYDINDPFWGENLKKGIQNLAKKVLENPGIEKYLEGINIEENKYPKIKSIDKTAKIVVPEYDISGTWSGEFIDQDDISNKVILQISQDRNSLSGSAITTLMVGAKQTVVQTMMNGEIDNNGKVSLHGVNYTFVERGNASGHVLDSYMLEFDQEKNLLIGYLLSNPHELDFKTELKLTLINES